VTNLNGVEMDSVSIQLSGDWSDTVKAEHGMFDFNIVRGRTCDIQPLVCDTTGQAAHITQADLVLAEQHWSGAELLKDPYQIIALDINGDDAITSVDVMLLKSFIGGTIPSFPQGRVWNFVRSDAIFSDLQNPFPVPGIRDHDSIYASTDQNFHAVLLGDINLSHLGKYKTEVVEDLNTQNDEQPLKILSIAPNPFSRSFTVSYETDGSAPVVFELYSSQGRRVARQSRHVSPGRQTFKWAASELEVADLADGIYILRLYSQNESTFHRLLFKSQ
ncbi:MAG: T9SS type A sorting domain-containing protein, partial [Bacteroidota bacterium]